ncbi:nucleotidyltransferase domain-containing protein [archaeon]|nr:MAG: nucleotidyltransferase domain-containing protein [archaeon]RLG64955.1 MAG: nucleotidyltransferase domain-containing protein [archaeon]
MLRRTVVDFQLEKLKAYRKYYEDPWRYLRAIKEIVRRFDENARVIVFGSFVRGDMKVDSDIDVLVITELARDAWKIARLRVEIKRGIGEISPFEVHIATPNEFESWYRRFIDKFVEV